MKKMRGKEIKKWLAEGHRTDTATTYLMMIAAMERGSIYIGTTTTTAITITINATINTTAGYAILLVLMWEGKI